ncbi:MAG: hypothetical protein KA275_05285, partial [Chitinophagaceae bacterium]|nr:hypothetical protein [Chitinophagaceae bacterium]
MAVSLLNENFIFEGLPNPIEIIPLKGNKIINVICENCKIEYYEKNRYFIYPDSSKVILKIVIKNRRNIDTVKYYYFSKPFFIPVFEIANQISGDKLNKKRLLAQVGIFVRNKNNIEANINVRISKFSYLALRNDST